MKNDIALKAMGGFFLFWIFYILTGLLFGCAHSGECTQITIDSYRDVRIVSETADSLYIQEYGEVRAVPKTFTFTYGDCPEEKP